jgi:hypothetical protein
MSIKGTFGTRFSPIERARLSGLFARVGVAQIVHPTGPAANGGEAPADDPKRKII